MRVMRAGRAVAGCVMVLGLAACMPPSRQVPLVPGKPRDLEHVTSAERKAALQKASVWRPIDTASLDLLAGPPGKSSFAFDQPVTCAFSAPEGGQTGATPKFDCAITPDDVVKVKYGRTNGEVFTEVAATRLFWALGFGADRVYPVKVTCRDCPIEPWYFSTERRVGEKQYDLATIERRLGGKKIEAWGEPGWSFKELDLVDERAAPRAHRDALMLLMAFIQDSDTKRDNQRILCLPGKSTTDDAGNEHCSETFLFVQDLGYSFGHATFFNMSRLDLSAWEKVPIWKDPGQCVATLKRSSIGTLEHPKIGEAGRAFLAERLALLSDKQIHDIFVAARFDRRGKGAVDDWVRVFKKKRAEIADHHCPA